MKQSTLLSMMFAKPPAAKIAENKKEEQDVVVEEEGRAPPCAAERKPKTMARTRREGSDDDGDGGGGREVPCDEDVDVNENAPSERRRATKRRKVILDDDDDDDAQEGDGDEGGSPAGAQAEEEAQMPADAGSTPKPETVGEDSRENGGTTGTIPVAESEAMAVKAKGSDKPKKKSKTASTKAAGEDPDVTEASQENAAKLIGIDIQAMITWKAGESVPYSFLVEVFEDISNHTKRFIITEKLTNAFRAIMSSTPDDLLSCVFLASGSVAAPHKGLELGGKAAISHTFLLGLLSRHRPVAPKSLFSVVVVDADVHDSRRHLGPPFLRPQRTTSPCCRQSVMRC